MGMIIIIFLLCTIADCKSLCNRELKALVIPQPGQLCPDKSFHMQIVSKSRETRILTAAAKNSGIKSIKKNL